MILLEKQCKWTVECKWVRENGIKYVKLDKTNKCPQRSDGYPTEKGRGGT